MGGSRPAGALAVFLVTVLLFGGVAGFAQANDGPGVEDFQTVAPERGERGLYEATVTGDWAGTEKGAGPFPYLAFEWTDDEVVRDADGRRQVVNVVNVTHQQFHGSFAERQASWQPVAIRYRFDPETGWPADMPFAFASSVDTAGPGFFVPLETNSQSDLSGEVRNLRWLDTPECFFRHPYQSDVESHGHAPELCAAPGNGWMPTLGVGLKVVGIEDDADFGRVLHARSDRIELWYSPAVSVPVRFSVTDRDHDGDGTPDDGVLQATLVEYERGSGDLHDIVEVDPDPLPPVGHVPRTRLGPDDRGLVALPLHDVLDDAVTWPPFADWTRAHPDWAVVEARSTWATTQDKEDFRWSVQLAEGRETFSFDAWRGQRLHAVPLPASDIEYRDRGTRTLEHPLELATTMPAIEGAVSWHEAYLGSEAQTWSWIASCGGNDLSRGLVYLGSDGCGSEMFVGDDRRDIDLVAWYAGAGQAYSVAWSGLGFTERGDLVLMEHVAATVDAEPSALEMVAGAPPAEDPSGEASVGGFWSPPTIEQAAGIGVLALLAAVLYYFWPSLKALPFIGGFTRIKKDEVEDHPARAAIMEVVRAEPGVHFQELRRRAGLAVGTARHHVAQLEAQGRLVKRKANGYACYFAGPMPRTDVEAAPLLRSPGARKVLDAVRDWPGASNKDLAGVTGLSPATVSYHLKRLGEAGVVTTQRTAQGLRVEAA